MKQIYESLNSKTFKSLSTGLLLFADISIFTYIYLKFSDIKMFEKSLELILLNVPQARASLPHDFQEQMYQLLIKSLLSALVFVGIFHLIIYISWHFEKKYARQYIYTYTYAGVFCCILTIIFNLTGPISLTLMALVLGLLFFFVARGLSIFKNKEQ